MLHLVACQFRSRHSSWRRCFATGRAICPERLHRRSLPRTGSALPTVSTLHGPPTVALSPSAAAPQPRSSAFLFSPPYTLDPFPRSLLAHSSSPFPFPSPFPFVPPPTRPHSPHSPPPPLEPHTLLQAWADAYGLSPDSLLPPSPLSLPPSLPPAPHLEDCAALTALRQQAEQRGERGELPP
ncbi:unnamed protein product, partial [Closterium sp. NIES-54]